MLVNVAITEAQSRQGATSNRIIAASRAAAAAISPVKLSAYKLHSYSSPTGLQDKAARMLLIGRRSDRYALMLTLARSMPAVPGGYT